jgi:hypothetical protein
MALQIGRAFQDGIDEFLSERGAVFAGAFIVLGLVNGIIWASLTQRLTELFIGSLPSDAQTQAAMGGTAPLALDIPIAVAAVGALGLFVVSEALNIVAIRAFASDATDPIPDNVGRRLGKTVAVAIAVGVLTAIAVGMGLILLVIPGLVLALLFFCPSGDCTERQRGHRVHHQQHQHRHRQPPRHVRYSYRTHGTRTGYRGRYRYRRWFRRQHRRSSPASSACSRLL